MHYLCPMAKTWSKDTNVSPIGAPLSHLLTFNCESFKLLLMENLMVKYFVDWYQK